MSRATARVTWSRYLLVSWLHDKRVPLFLVGNERGNKVVWGLCTGLDSSTKLTPKDIGAAAFTRWR